MPLVSVIIPTYNDAHYLKDSIASITNQTFTDWEIIIVNDGTTNSDCLQILANINNPKITVLHKQNGHLAAARNFGIASAKGSIIVTLDADDKFEKTFLQKGVTILNKNKHIGVVTCYLKSFGNRNFKWQPLGGSIQNFLYRLECTASAMYRKQCWVGAGGYDEQMKLGYEDWEYWIRVTACGWEVAVIPQYLLLYRTTANQMSVTQSEPNREKIINYIMTKHKDLYYTQLKASIVAKKILDLTHKKTAKKQLLKNMYWAYTNKL